MKIDKMHPNRILRMHRAEIKSSYVLAHFCSDCSTIQTRKRQKTDRFHDTSNVQAHARTQIVYEADLSATVQQADKYTTFPLS